MSAVPVERLCVCGVHEVAYRRSKDGRVIHRVSCSRLGKTSVEWHYAATKLDNDHERVLSEIRSIPWLVACSYCMKEASHG